MTTRRLKVMAGWYGLWIVVWIVFRPAIFPNPFDVLGAFPGLWTQDGLAEALQSSLVVSLEALAVSMCIAFPIAYLCAVRAKAYGGYQVREIVRPLADSLGELRFLSPAMFFLLLLFVFSSAHVVKVAMLVLGETFFLLRTMLGVVDAVPEENFDDCRTLKMNEWQAVWYAIVRGTLHDAIHAIRDNNGMGWMALPMVEGIIRSEGGVGVLMLNNEKHQNFAELWAIATAVLIVALASDLALDYLDRWVCPYAVEA